MMILASATQPKQQITVNADAADAKPLPPGFAVDVGFPENVSEIHERALAVLVAAAAWASETGGRLRFAAMSPALLDTAGYFGVTDLLPRLPGPGGRAGEAAHSQAR